MLDDDDDLLTPAGGIQTQYGLNDQETRYLFPAPPGERLQKNGYRRMTKVVAAFSDQERLQLWLEWKAFMGLREADGVLYDEWMAEDLSHLDANGQKQLANRYADRARKMAHAEVAARRGTARHAMMDTFMQTGVPTGTRTMRMQLQSALLALEAHGLEPIPGESERRLWHPVAGGTMGTRDLRVLDRRTGRTGVLDWKTQVRFWTWQEIAGQLYGYDSAPWTWDGPPSDAGGWVPSEENTLTGHPDGTLAGKRVALVAHMPGAPGGRGAFPPPVEIYEVDLEYGRQVLQTAERNIELRSIGRSVAVGRRPGELRPSRVAPQL